MRGELEVIVLDPDTATPWDAVKNLLEGGCDVLVRRLENASDDEVADLAAITTGHRRAAAHGRENLLLFTACIERSSPAVKALIERWGTDERTHALADTPDRIPALVRAILDRVDATRRHSMSPAALQSLMQWNWPGNIAELSDVVTAISADTATSVIERRHLPEYLQRTAARRKMTLMEVAERDAIVDALGQAGGNRSHAAELLGIGRTTLYRRMRQLGLDDGEASL